MKQLKNNNFNLFPSGRSCLLLLLMVFSINSFAQIHVSKNTIFIVKENTTIYLAENNIDSLLVANSKETQPERVKKIAVKHKKTRGKPQQPPMFNKDSGSAFRASVLSFTSRQQESDSFFYSGKRTKAALVNTGSFGVKSFPQKKAYNNVIHLILLIDSDEKVKSSFSGILISQQTHLEEYITRPPPFLSESHSEIT